MSGDEPQGFRDSLYRDRRAHERYEIDAPGGCLNYRGTKFPCHVLDVSLSGCRVRTESCFHPGNLANVEIVLPLLGMVLRMVGTTQWVNRQNLIGIRFHHPSSSSKNQFASLLTGLVDESAVEEVRAAVVAASQVSATNLKVTLAEVKPEDAKVETSSGENQANKACASPAASDKPAQHGQSVPSGEKGEWPAILYFLKDGSHLTGVVSGLSLQGCRLQSSKPFVAEIHVRVEVDFQMRGLPFRLVGVIEDVLGDNTVSIRFLDVSRRKREELEELLEELKESETKQAAAAEGKTP